MRSVWKTPAGIKTTFLGIRGFSFRMTDNENGQIRWLALNVLRNFLVHAIVAWGADQLTSQWKYVLVWRIAVFIEESLDRRIQWVVFEPSDEPSCVKI